MAALACLMDDMGYEVKGSDLPTHFFPEDELRRRGIEILDFDESNIQDGMTVIIGNAFLEDFPEVKAARSNPTCTCMRYHECVGQFIRRFRTIAAAGSHGKTTTTGMLASMMSHIEPTGWLIGDGSGHVTKDSVYFCLEADEFRRHFLPYYPEYAIITNVDLDNVDYFKDEEDYRSAYEEFAGNVAKGLIIYGEDEQARMLKLPQDVPHYWYGEREEDDIRAVNIQETSDHMTYTVLFQGKEYGTFTFPFVGHHLLLNSLACIGVGILEGLDPKLMEEGLAAFHGVKRRFVVKNEGENVFIDDYAHHPTEVAVTLDAAKKRYPDRKLTAVLKPHRASRVKYFAEQFASAMSSADSIYLMEFGAVDDKQDGTDIDISYLLERTPGAKFLPEDETGVELLASEAPCVYVFMSSKDIYTMEEALSERLKETN